MRWSGLLFVVGFLATAGAFAQAEEPRAVEKTIPVDGRERTYRVFVPESVKKAVPVVLVLHGGGSSAVQMERYSRFNPVAAREGFIVVYPDAIGRNWNDGRGLAFMPAQRDRVDDVKFFKAIVDALAKAHDIDRGRIFSTGMSNGGIMSHYLATQEGEWLAGIAPVVAGMTPGMVRTFPSAPPISLLMIQG